MVIAVALALLFAVMASVGLFLIVDHFRTRTQAMLMALGLAFTFVVLYWAVWRFTIRPYFL